MADWGENCWGGRVLEGLRCQPLMPDVSLSRSGIANASLRSAPRHRSAPSATASTPLAAVVGYAYVGSQEPHFGTGAGSTQSTRRWAGWPQLFPEWGCRGRSPAPGRRFRSWWRWSRCPRIYCHSRAFCVDFRPNGVYTWLWKWLPGTARVQTRVSS